VPIGCGDVAVFPGDVIVGDARAWSSSRGNGRGHRRRAVEMTAFEDFVTEGTQGARSSGCIRPPLKRRVRISRLAEGHRR
jgi:regulator of RNase E activity RraA